MIVIDASAHAKYPLREEQSAIENYHLGNPMRYDRIHEVINQHLKAMNTINW